jgi:sugar lactone lactonase YvrE
MTRKLPPADLMLDARVDLGEGPMWHPERRLVSWVELYAGRVNWLGLGGRAAGSVEVGKRVGAAVPGVDGTLALAADEGFARLREDGSYELLAPVEPAAADSFMNDGKCDASGRFWAGTVGVREDGLAADGAGALYCLEPDGSVRRVLSGVSLSNGMDWSPDGLTFYFIDSRLSSIDAFAFDVSSGELGDRRPIELGLPAGAFADGMCVDSDGCLWAAIWGTGEVRRYTPSGRLDSVVPVPVTQPTSCVFAGDDLDVLVITSARRTLSEARLENEPHAGGVFACRPGVSGFPPHPCRAA